jgi:serine/threonine protein phosphatase PrpC
LTQGPISGVRLLQTSSSTTPKFPALAIGDDGYSCPWAGDSRACLLRDGNLRQLTRDRSLVQQLVDSGDLELLADRWVEVALARRAPDNFTFVLMRVTAATS